MSTSRTPWVVAIRAWSLPDTVAECLRCSVQLHIPEMGKVRGTPLSGVIYQLRDFKQVHAECSPPPEVQP